MSDRRAPVIAGIVGVAVLALVIIFAISPKGEQADTSSPIVGQLAPELAGSTLGPEPFDIDDHRGQWVLVNFFATWCPPCVAEHPELIRFANAGGDAVQVVTVAYNESVDDVRAFFAENGGDWPVITDSADGAALDYGVKKLPESFLVDPSGTVVSKINGGVTAADLQEVISR